MDSALQVDITINEDGRGVLKSPNHFDIIRDCISCTNYKATHAPAYAKRHMPKRIYFIDKDGTFPIGLVEHIFKFCVSLDPTISDERSKNLPWNQRKFRMSDEADYFNEPSFLLPPNPVLHQFEGFEYRDIQVESLGRIFARGRGIAHIATAGGKSLIAASIIKTLWKYNPTTTFAFIVPTHLVSKTVEEMKGDFKFTDSEITGWSGKLKPDFNVPVIVVGQHIATSREEEFARHISNRGVILIDECHIIKHDGKITERIRSVKTNNIIGFTGTIPEELHNKFTVIGEVGKVICEVSTKKLKDKGFKASSKVIGLRLDGSGFDNTETDNLKAFQAEKEFLLRNPVRNEFIRKWVLSVCNDGNVLIPVDLDYHEQILTELYDGCGRNVFVINGSTPEEERTKIYKAMEHETNAILIVKVGVMREGISINNLSYMIGYYIGKSYIRVVQLLGRIERLGGNTVPIFYDFFDDLPFSKKQFKTRANYYLKEKIDFKFKTVNLKCTQ